MKPLEMIPSELSSVLVVEMNVRDFFILLFINLLKKLYAFVLLENSVEEPPEVQNTKYY